MDAPTTGGGSPAENVGAPDEVRPPMPGDPGAAVHARKLEALGRSLGGLAHDFNNLLTVIAGNGRLLLERMGPDSALRPELEQMMSVADQAAELTAEILMFSRQDASRPRGPLDVSAVLRGMERVLRGAVGDQVQLCLRLDRALPAVVATPADIQQVVLNLVLNGRDAMPQGGRLELATGYVRVHERDAAPGEGRFGGYVRLTVRAEGSEMSERIGMPTGPMDAAAPGLEAVRTAVASLGGSVRVEAGEVGGSAVMVHLPVAPAPASDRRRVGTVAGESACAETLLVVEDDVGVRTLTRRILSRQGYTVLEAGDGAEALRVVEAAERPIDLLLSDVVMPVLGGVELGRRLREDRPGLRVLYMSGYPEDVIGLTEMSPFMKKPFTPDELARRVRALLDTAPETAAGGTVAGSPH